jgi:hypothetical protein
MNMKTYSLSSGVRAVPFVNSWFAHPYLISPDISAMPVSSFSAVGDHDEARGNDEAQRSARSAGGGDEVNGRHMPSAISTERGRR